MWKLAIEDALRKTKMNIGRFGDRFPHVSEDGGGGTLYSLNDNDEWTDGFWSGMLWLSYEYSGDSAFKEAAIRTVDSFRRRLARRISLEHHDIGFLYTPSAMAQWMLERDESARQLALRAADTLTERWREGGGFIQAWGTADDPDNGGRIIIDCLMNLPLLYWASGQSGDGSYMRIAKAHAEKSRRYLVRGDDSSYHTFLFVPETGEPVGGRTHQGYTNGSCWTRGQAWGIYGFALSCRYTGDATYLETAKRLARYFLARLPEDGVVYWDFEVPVDDAAYRDSSAAAIAAAGLLELASLMSETDPERETMRGAAEAMVGALAQRYATSGEDERQGLLKRGSYHVRGDQSPDDHMIWGDYFYLEALMRLAGVSPGYWYER